MASDPRPPRTTGARRGLRRPLRALLTVLVLGLVGPGALGLSPAAAAGTDAWYSGTGGPGNTFFNPGESVLTPSTAGRVQQAWAAQQRGVHLAPTVVGGVVYYVDNSTTGDASRLIAASPRTGARLWSLPLPRDQRYRFGISVVGDLAVMSYGGMFGKRAGVTAVNLRTHRAVWNKALPPLPAEYSWLDGSLPGQLVADATRVYVTGGSTNLTAHRLSDGALLWSKPMSAPFRAASVAVADGVVYAGGTEADRGILTAFSATTGNRLWSARSGGLPVVAGGRVFSVNHTATGIAAFAAGGCGKSVCPPLWNREIPDLVNASLHIGGANGSTLFATWAISAEKGTLARISAATGAVLWSAPAGGTVVGTPVRGGDVVWVLTAGPSTTTGQEYRLKAFAATGSNKAPLRTIVQPYGVGYSDQDIAVAAGTVLVQSWPSTLTAYRIPGT